MLMGVGWGKLLTCPYPLKVQACLPRYQRPALQSEVSGEEEIVEAHHQYLKEGRLCFI